MKRSISLLLALVLVLQMMGLPAFAAEGGTPTVRASQVTGAAGQIVDVAISLENNPGIVSMILTVHYDSALTLMSVRDTGLLPGQLHKPTMSNPYYLSWANDTAASDYTVNGDIAVLSFAIPEGAEEGTVYAVQVSYDAANSEILNYNMDDVFFAVADGSVTVSCEHEAKTEVPAKEPDCFQSGNSRYFVCDLCGRLLDPQGNETTLDAVTIPAKGHSPAADEPAAASCEAPGLTAGVHCSVCGTVLKAQEVIEALGHDFTAQIADEAHLVPGTGADCQSARQYYYGCSRCDAVSTETWEAGEYGEHQLSEQWFCEDGKHFRRCTAPGCDYTTEPESCSGGNADCRNRAVCAVCGNEYGTLAEHVYSESWDKDAENHWHSCTVCGEADVKSSHTPDREVPTSQYAVLCTVCGYELQPRAVRVVITAPANQVIGGNSLKLTAAVEPADAGYTVNRWTAEPNTYASISSKGLLTTKPVTEPVTVSVTAIAVNDRGEECSASAQIQLCPRAAEVRILRDGADVTGSTLVVDVNTVHSLTLTGVCLPETSISGLSWSCSNEAVLQSNMSAAFDGSSVTLSNLHLVNNKEVSLTLAAAAEDAGAASGYVTLNLVSAPKGVEMEGVALDPEDNTLHLCGGTTRTFKAKLLFDAPVSNKSVVWSVIQSKDTAYASISASGKLTTKAVSVPVRIAVVAASKTAPDVRSVVEITLVPVAYKAMIGSEIPAENGMIHMQWNGGASVQLIGKTLPASALQTGTWKSSSTKIATVSADGKVTFLKPGTVTITFKSSDSGKKSASVQVNAGVGVRDISISGSNELTAGAKTKLTASVNADATVKTVAWSVAAKDIAWATVNSSGTVTAKTVAQPQTVTVIAKAMDGTGITAAHEITIRPKPNVTAISENGVVVNNMTLYCDLGSKYMNLTAAPGTVFSVSNAKLAAVDAYGQVTFLKAGTVTVTAKNGSASGKVTVVIGTLAQSVTVSKKDASASTVLTSGKGKLNLVASVSADATNKNVIWTSSNPDAASVSASGVVTAKSGVYENTEVTITAVTRDSAGTEQEKSGSITVTVIPLATTLSVVPETALTTVDGINAAAGEALNGRTLKVDIDKFTKLNLDALVYPNADGATASQAVTWKSSSSAIASVNADGTVTFLKTGSVTITATAKDGSGKKNTVKLTVGRFADRIVFSTPEMTEVKSGKKLTLKYTLSSESGLPLTSKAVAFYLSPADAQYASVSAKGVLTIQKLKEDRVITVYAVSKDDPTVRTSLKIMAKK